MCIYKVIAVNNAMSRVWRHIPSPVGNLKLFSQHHHYHYESEFSYLNYYDVLDGSDVEGPNTKEEKATRKSGGKSF